MRMPGATVKTAVDPSGRFAERPSVSVSCARRLVGGGSRCDLRDMIVHGRVALSAVAAVLVLASCHDEQAVEPMPRETFVEVIVELRRAATQNPTQAEFEARKEEILEEANVTDSALVEYVRLHGHELERMAEVWDSVNARLRAAEDSIR